MSQSPTDGQTTFLDLPHDLLINILYELNDGIDVVSCSKVCRRLKEIIRDAASLQYLIGLVVAGLKNGPPGGPSLGERFKALDGYKEAVNSSQLPCGFLRLKSQQAPFIDLQWTGGGVILTDPAIGDGVFTIIRPPSFFSGIDHKVWPVNVRPVLANTPIINHISVKQSFAVDVGQDLLVVVIAGAAYGGWEHADQPECHLFSISGGGTPHPLAAQAKLVPSITESYPAPLCQDIEIAGDLLLWTVCRAAPSSRFIFKWKTGQCVWHDRSLNYSAFDPLCAMSCHVLDARHLLEVSDRKLFIYKIGRTRTACKGVHLVLDLPRLAQNHWAHSIESTVQRSSPPVDCSLSFEDDPNLALLILVYQVRLGAVTVRSVVIFIPIASLIELAVRTRRRTPPKEGPRVLKWDKWGPPHARVVIFNGFGINFGASAGPRICFPATDGASAATTDFIDVYTLDVRPRGRGLARRAMEDIGGPESAVWISDCYTVAAAPMFAKPVRSEAPCQIIKQRIAGRPQQSELPHFIYDGLCFSGFPPE